jgi:hypothetical protein
MRILILNADYEDFLRGHYRADPGLAGASYASQMAARNQSLFAVADFYSRNFRAHGHEAREVHVNNPFLQRAWARENGLDIEPTPLDLGEERRSALAGIKRVLAPIKPLLKPFVARGAKPGLVGPLADVLSAQIAAFQPDVILNQEMSYIRPAFFSGILPKNCLLVGQIGSELPQYENFRDYDLVITSLPDFVNWFRARGVNAHLNQLAFEETVLEAMGPPPVRDIPVSFVGSLMSVHKERIDLLEHIASAIPLTVWGNGIERLSRNSPLHTAFRGAASGRKMYEIMRRSRITINQHGFIPLVRNIANNMRLYEATGMGSLLLTDAKSNLGAIFEVGREVVSYTSPQDCLDKIRHYLADEDERAAIAAAGQRRTLADHNYFKRTGEILDLISAC